MAQTTTTSLSQSRPSSLVVLPTPFSGLSSLRSSNKSHVPSPLSLGALYPPASSTAPATRSATLPSCTAARATAPPATPFNNPFHHPHTRCSSPVVYSNITGAPSTVDNSSTAVNRPSDILAPGDILEQPSKSVGRAPTRNYHFDPPLTAGILPSMTELSRQRLESSTRSRAMGDLNDAIQRRLANQYSHPSTTPPVSPISRQPLILAGGLINPKRDERKALGLKAAVGSYRKRASQDNRSGSDCSSNSSDSPPHEQLTHRIEPPPLVPASLRVSPSSAPLVDCSRYLAERRESIMQRAGGHRRVVSETMLGGLARHTSLGSARKLPPGAALPSLDQIQTWAASRKQSNEKETLEVKPSEEVKGKQELDRPRPVRSTDRRSRSLKIYCHARDPSIPQICLSPDTDDDDDDDDELSQELEHAMVTNTTAIIPREAGESNKDTIKSDENRAEQRRFLFNNLAQAQQRRNRIGKTSGGPSMMVAPV